MSPEELNEMSFPVLLMTFVITQIHKNHTLTQKFNKGLKLVCLILNEILDFPTVFQESETTS